MAKFTSFYKIVQPKTQGESIINNNQDLVGAGSYSNNAWYQSTIKGLTSRMVQYQQYSSMDADVEVSRALNTIAEEMTGNDPKTNTPINLELLTTDKTKYDSTEVLTLKAALSRWNDIHDWESKLFAVCRNTVKFGDVFFRKHKDKFDRKWEYIDSKNVVAAAVNPDDVTKVIAWQVRSQIKKPKTALSPIQKDVSGSDDFNTVWVPASEIVQITLNDEMSEAAPFGISILAPVYKAYKQKELMEDATIIYRVQRAPERRVFYVDVGNVPAQRAKAQIEQYKNDIKQKKIPSFNGGKQTVDSVYNPQSMNEDFFVAVRPEGRGSRIESLPGGTGGGDTDELEYFQRRLWEGLNIPTSYMMTGDDSGASFNDGKVGVAYIQELRFAQFIGRLQRNIENELDKEFKIWLKKAGIYVDPLLYRLRLPSPSNFGKYRQQEMDGNLLGQYGTADGIEYMSKRFAMKRYLQLTDEEIVMNDRMKREELGIPLDDNSPEMLKQIYSGMPAEEGMDGGFGGESLDTTSETEDLPDDDGGDAEGESESPDSP